MDKKDLQSLKPIYPFYVQKYTDFVPKPENQNFIAKLNSTIDYLNKIGSLNNQTVRQWNEVMKWITEEGLENITEEEVVKQFESYKDEADSISGELGELKSDVEQAKEVSQEAKQIGNTIKVNGDYAKSQGDYAKEQAEKSEEQYERLKDTDVNEISLQLIEQTEEIRTTQNNPTNYTGAMVSIIDDDARPDFRTVWKPYLDDNPDVKISIAVVKDWTEDGSALSLSELHSLQDNGQDILCHTSHHEASYLITPERAEIDYPVAKQWMKNNGLKGYEYLVYPGGLSPSFVNIKDVARKYFKYAVSTPSAGSYAISPVDNWCIGRVNGDTSTLEQLKSHVDTAKLNGYWLIIMTHSHELKELGSQKMRDFISYVKSVNVPIKTFSEAVKLKGNAVALGEYTQTNNMFVGVDGKAKGLSAYATGDWSPTLIGSTVSGTHTYVNRKGTYTRNGNMVTVSFNIRIDYTSLDNNMSGNLRITGLPYTKSANEQGAKGLLEYNHLTLGSNYTHAIVTANGLDYLGLLKQGNGVSTSFLTKSDLTPNQVILLSGQVSYRIA